MDTLTKCPICGNRTLTRRRGHHHFLESGLDNVHLVNTEILVCDKCGEEIVSIPQATKLMKNIGESILLKPGPLSGAEIRFLRKNLGLKITEFSQMLGVDRVTVSRWENGHETPAKSSDRLIRLIYLTETEMDTEVVKRLREHLKKGEIESELDYFIPCHSYAAKVDATT